MNQAQSLTAQDARNFIAFNRLGLLSTISKSQHGFPFGSIAPYDVTDNGDLIIYVSFLAEHYKNLSTDPRASLTAVNYFGYDDPQANSRATILCEFAAVPPEQSSELQKSYERRFPNTINHEIAHNFTFMRGTIKRIRWIAGFGEIGWINPDKYYAAVLDPVCYAGMSAVQHLNEDHADSLKRLAQSTIGGEVTGQVQITELCSTDFTLVVRGHGKRQIIKIPFPEPVSEANDLRAAFIGLLK